MFEQVVECPRCKRTWIIQQGTPGITCNCHLYCSQGTKPSDCSTTLVTDNVQLGWPIGIHVDAENEGDDVMHRVRYCSTHKKYIYKTPVWIEADWDEYYSKRAPRKFRQIGRGEG